MAAQKAVRPAWLVEEVQAIGVSPDVYRITFIHRGTKDTSSAELKYVAGSWRMVSAT